jgi:hypothetical protein
MICTWRVGACVGCNGVTKSVSGQWKATMGVVLECVVSFVVNEHDLYSRAFNPEVRRKAWACRRLLVLMGSVVDRKCGGGVFRPLEVLPVVVVQSILDMEELAFSPCEQGRGVYCRDIAEYVGGERQ